MQWSEVVAAADPFGFAPPSVDTPSVGVVGYPLGGGLSWLSRMFGFAADSLLRAELVTVDGRVIMARRGRVQARDQLGGGADAGSHTATSW